MNNDPRYQAPQGASYPQQPPSGQYPPQGPGGPYPPQQPGYPPYPQQVPMQQPAPPKKKANKFAIGCGGLVGLVVIIAAISMASGGKSNSINSAPSKPQTWQTTHTYTGNGAKKTETITAANDWKIQWSCTPSSFMGNSYNVIIGVYNSDGTPADMAAVNTMCKDGNTSGETEEHTGGNVYLDVNSEGDWKIDIQELK